MSAPVANARHGHLAMFIFSALIAGSFALGGMSAPFIEPAALNAARFALGLFAAGSIAAALGQLPRGTFRAPWRYVILGALFATYFVTMFEALKTVSPVSTSAVFTLTPFIAAFVGWALLGQRLNGRTASALLIGGLGAVWVIFRADWQAIANFDVGTGEIVFFCGCIAHAIYPTATRLLNRGEPAMAVNVGMLAAGLLLLVIYGWSEIWTTNWAKLPAIVWVTITYTALVSGVTTFTLLQFASLRLPAGKVMAYTYLVPVWVILWELALGQSLPSVTLLAGIALIVVALLMLLGRDHAPVAQQINQGGPND